MSELVHYGILGMKWGVRKDGKPQGYLYEKNNRKRNKQFYKELDSARKKAHPKAGWYSRSYSSTGKNQDEINNRWVENVKKNKDYNNLRELEKVQTDMYRKESDAWDKKIKDAYNSNDMNKVRMVEAQYEKWLNDPNSSSSKAGNTKDKLEKLIKQERQKLYKEYTDAVIADLGIKNVDAGRRFFEQHPEYLQQALSRVYDDAIYVRDMSDEWG